MYPLSGFRHQGATMTATVGVDVGKSIDKDTKDLKDRIKDGRRARQRP